MTNKIALSLAIIGLTALSACSHKQHKHAETPVETTEASGPSHAQAVLKSAKGHKVTGTIHFTENGHMMKIDTMVNGLKPGPHGFHIHETGDCSKADFTSAGGHFNPDKKPHGSATGDQRHAGDMGNLVADNKGKAHTSMEVHGMTMKDGPHSIIGKAVIIHADPDDLKSQPVGNAGARVACGIVEAM